MTIADLLHLYYSFDYFKKLAIQEVYQVSDYSEISKYSESFDLFAMNPTNLIVNGLPVFEETDIPKIIVNKYSLNNIRLDESTLEPSNLQSLLNKILLVLRVEKIKRSTTSVEKIWFMVQVDKIMAQDQEAKK